MPHQHDIVPSSSPARPTPGDDLRNRPRPSSPLPEGDEVELESKTTPHTSNNLVPTNGTTWNPGTTWLTTPRGAPAWTAALHLLEGERWHPTQELAAAMHNASDLAPRTIENHIRSASARRWITRRRGKVRLRDRTLIEAALDAAEAGR